MLDARLLLPAAALLLAPIARAQDAPPEPDAPLLPSELAFQEPEPERPASEVPS